MQKRSRTTILLGVAVLVSLIISACGSSGTGGGGNGTSTASCPSVSGLTGAGSTFDNPLFSQMFAPSNYPTSKCGVNVNYQSVGSGAGINQLLAHTVDFGATDTPLTDAQEAESTSGTIIHVPVTLGAVAMSYNLAGVSGHLNLTPAIIAGVYLGTITSWSDPSIKAANSGVTLPNEKITIIHRSDGSGTTGIFTHYLSAVSSTWSSKVGAATTVNWPVGVGGKGSAGVAAAIKSTVWGHRLRGTGVRAPEQPLLCRRPECQHEVRPALARWSQGGCGKCDEHSRRLAILHRQCPGRRLLPHFGLLVGGRVPEAEQYQQGRSRREHAVVDDARRSAVRHAARLRAAACYHCDKR